MNSLAYVALVGCMVSAALGAVIVGVLVSGCGFAWSEGQPEDDRQRARVTRVGHAAAGLSFFFAALFALVALAGASSELPSRLPVLGPGVAGLTSTLGRITEAAERLRVRADHWTASPVSVDTPSSRPRRATAPEPVGAGRSAQRARVERFELIVPPASPSGIAPFRTAAASPPAPVEVVPELPARGRVVAPVPPVVSAAEFADVRSAARAAAETRAASSSVPRPEPSGSAPAPVVAVTPAPSDVQAGPATAPESSPPDPRGGQAERDVERHETTPWFERPDEVKRGEGARPPKVERPEKVVTMERPRKSDRLERPEKIDRRERIERIERPDKIERPERVERIERPEKAERVERPARVERLERSGRH